MEHQWDIYANVEEPSHDDNKWRREMNRSENIYANENKMHILEPNKTGAALSAAGGEKRSLCRAAAVCLGLLFLLLLTGLITLVSLYTKGNSVWRKEKILLERSNDNLTKERDELQTSYNNLTKEQEELQTSYSNLTKEQEELQTSYSNLTKEQEELQTSYNILIKERDQLQKRFEDLAKEKNDLQKKLQDWNNQGGWVYFRNSFYYISSLKKSWQESRDDCLSRGADLVIINSKEEQDFTRSFKRLMWIGLTDRQTEGTWRWVDGTPLTTSYWASGEPNGEPGRDEDCAEIKMYDSDKSWNDESCNLKISWICEKPSSP